MPTAVASEPRPVMTSAEQTAARRMGAGLEGSALVKGLSREEALVIGAVQKSASENNPRAATKALASDFRFASTYEQTAEAMVKTGRDPTGERRAQRDGTTEDSDFDRVNKRTEVNVDLLAKGYEGLTDTQKSTLREQIDEFITSSPDLLKALGGKGKIPEAVYAKVVSSEEFQDSLRGILEGEFNPTNIPSDLEAILFTTQNKVTNVVKEVEVLTGKKGEQESVRNDAKTAKDKFEKDVDPKYAKSKEEKYKELVDSGVEARHQAAKQTYDQARANAGGIRTAEFQAAEKAYNAALSDPDVITYRELAQQRNTVNTNYKNADQELSTVNTEFLTKQTELITARSQLEKASLDRIARSKEFTHKVTNAVRESTKAYFISADAIMQEFPEQKEELLAHLRQEAANKLQEYSDSEFIQYATKTERAAGVGPIRFGKDRTVSGYEVGKAKIQGEVDAIVTAARPDATTGRDTLDTYMTGRLKAAGLEDSQISLLKQDQEYMKALTKGRITQVLAQHVKAGGTINQEMQSFLSVTPLGKEISMDMIQKSPEARAQVEAITGQPLSADSLEKIRKSEEGKKGKEGVLGILLLALMALAAASSKEFTGSRS